MLSIEKCNEILNKNEKIYTKEEVVAVREWLYQFAEIIINTKENEEPKR
jgi:hypothetical protein